VSWRNWRSARSLEVRAADEVAGDADELRILAPHGQPADAALKGPLDNVEDALRVVPRGRLEHEDRAHPAVQDVVLAPFDPQVFVQPGLLRRRDPHARREVAIVLETYLGVERHPSFGGLAVDGGVPLQLLGEPAGDPLPERASGRSPRPIRISTSSANPTTPA
jgi:hypothetical protein